MFRLLMQVCVTIVTGLLVIGCDERSSHEAKMPVAQGAGENPSTDRPVELTTQINRSPQFESPDGWGPGFAKAVGHGAGVVVGPGGGNPNVFAQQFPTKPGEPYKVVARASSVDKSGAKGRFQINWTDASGKFISTSIKAFEVVPEEKTFETHVEAPAGAVSGTLYVVADGPNDVVRYTEMRLLGKSVKTTPAGSPTDLKSTGKISSVEGQKTLSEKTGIRTESFPRPLNLTPLDGSGRALTAGESQYYFYQATKAMQRKANERGADFIMYVMPDQNIARLMPAIKQLRSEGIKVLAYEPGDNWNSGVDTDWYWQKADSHWTEAAVRLTADEILNMWKKKEVANRPFSKDLMTAYAKGFPSD